MGVVCRGRVASEETRASRALGARSAQLMAPQGREFHGFRAKQEESDTEVIPEASLTCPTDASF